MGQSARTVCMEQTIDEETVSHTREKNTSKENTDNGKKGLQNFSCRKKYCVHTMSQMGKEPIIAVIERRGEIIYYKVSTSVFAQNSR